MRTQQQQQPAAMILEPVTGQQEGKLRKCIVCQQELGQDWIRISRTGAGYSVAAHPGCLARRQEAKDDPDMSEQTKKALARIYMRILQIKAKQESQDGAG